MKRTSNRGFTLVESLIVILLVFAVIAVGIAQLNNERAQVRDARRIADMVRVAAAFDVLRAETNSYAAAAVGCGQTGVLVSTCTLQTYVSDISTITDPGKHNYTVTGVPDTDSYEVTFALERSYGSLTAGIHTVSELGIQ